jgi:putative PIN family toxin of toxin-antitoxin system
LIWAVLDTTTIVSAFLTPSGIPRRVLDLGLQGHFVMVTSRPLLDELARVLQYAKLAPYFDDPLSTVLLIERASVIVEPTATIHLLDDEPDNRLVEAALAVQADYIVTGDAGPLALATCNGAQIVRPRDFLVAIGSLPPDGA